MHWKHNLQLLLLCILISCNTFAQNAFQDKEHFTFKISYGFITAGKATLTLEKINWNNKTVFHAIGTGFTTGIGHMLFKVHDTYESYFDTETGIPYQSIRKIKEGSYKRNQLVIFNKKTNTADFKDFETQEEKSFEVPAGIHDMVSSFYNLRNNDKISDLNPGETVDLNMFFDKEIFNFKLKFIRKEEIKTTFGKIKTLRFTPLVQAGRVFKEKESLSVWVSDDKNRIPIKIQASLMVGSIKAELSAYDGLKYELGSN